MTENFMDGYSVKKATLEDVSKIAPLFNQYRMFYGQDSDQAGAEAFLKDRIERKESVIYFIQFTETQQAVGFTQLYPSFSSVSMKPTWILNDLYVQEAYRGRGLARRLMETASEFAKQSGAKGLELATAKDNHTAQKLYESLGYKRDEVFYHYFLSV